MQRDKVTRALILLQKVMNEERIDPKEGLPLELFKFTTTLLPFVNVDLLILNNKNQILLSWREDFYYGVGWQIPGGIIRMMETIDERIQKTALQEIGGEVKYDKEPIAIYENIIRGHRGGLNNQLERAHNIALLYKCRVSDDYIIDNADRNENDEGFLRWFDIFPDDLLECHKALRNFEQLKKWFPNSAN